jgi:hypothetical protein
MNWLEFSKQWIEKNIPDSEVYGGGIRVFVWQLAELLNNQKHSGMSFSLVMHYLNKMIAAYKGE